MSRRRGKQPPWPRRHVAVISTRRDFSYPASACFLDYAKLYCLILFLFVCVYIYIYILMCVCLLFLYVCVYNYVCIHI